ncbi:response regulator [uncultured Lamprocystis sp.]|jgi:twitching motility two-component system response regulator PilH|uniref:response regulator n=1 Tax=uncultured Lamprocystis sp. TaxID=543132 RepID=UPI0025EA2C86|nr:response regulator [uncultured Lamprocystis sp.]
MIRVSRSRDEAGPGPGTGSPAGASDRARATVLIVDDSPTESRIFSNTLGKAGYRVETATNGEQGIEMARRLQPDVILMDVIMPVLNGFQATRMLHRDAATAGIPIIMVTTKDQPTDRVWGMRQGAVDYLIKPVAATELLARVQAALQR